jgi:ATP-binding cassette subfamily B protein
VRITSGRSSGRHPGKRPQGQQAEAEGDELTAELSAFYWRAHDERLAEIGFVSIARQLPGLIGQAVRLGWAANRRDTAAAVATRAGLQAAAGWAQSRLKPQVDRVVEIRLLDLTTQVELAAYDDSAFYDAMQRARDQGLYAAPRW